MCIDYILPIGYVLLTYLPRLFLLCVVACVVDFITLDLISTIEGHYTFQNNVLMTNNIRKYKII